MGLWLGIQDWMEDPMKYYLVDVTIQHQIRVWATNDRDANRRAGEILQDYSPASALLRRNTTNNVRSASVKVDPDQRDVRL